MPNSQSINQTLPNFATTKNSTSAPELKTNSNNFNQVLKNEVVNKAKKINTEPQKNISAQNTKVYAAPNDTSKTVIDEEKTELQDTNKHDISDQEEQLPNNLSDPGSLLAFVNTVSALAKTSVEDATYNKTDLTISGMEQPINSTQLSPPITDNNKINTKELIEADQFRLEPDASDNANSTTSTSKSNAPSRIDTRDMLTAAHQVNAKDLDSSASAPASTSASASTSESESAPAPASALDIIKEQKNSLELLQTAPLNTTPGKIGCSGLIITDTKIGG
ncbi:MAG: hypothetical protein ACEQSE_13180 [Candidatus Aquirickettsiella gammari]